jgi:hypothetical protein
MGTRALLLAGWLPRGSRWIDPASGRAYTERDALRTHARDVERGDTCAVDGELGADPEYHERLDATPMGIVEALDAEALDRSAPVTEADLYAVSAPWAVGL